MIEHIVIVKFGESTTREQMQEAADRFKALQAIVEGIVDIQAGVNFSEKSQGYDLVLTVRFADEAAMNAYGPHPEHQKVAAFIRDIGREDSIVVDIHI